jgi:ligand-binding SRPBCC domain-containing protein
MPPRLPVPKPSVIQSSIEIDVPVEKLFRFHLDTRNAPLISPPDTRILSVDGTFPVKDGSEVRLKVQQMPIPIPTVWLIRIEAVVRNQVIIDVALKGPFPSWRHEHRFEALGPNRTRLTDRVTYTLPGGPMGPIVDKMIIRRKLTKAFADRHRNTKILMERD